MPDEPFIIQHSETSISGTTAPTCEDLRSWLEGVPGRATLRISESKTFPGEHGSSPWKITAAWDHEDATPTGDQRPHSRACGVRRHDHGPECHTNCPTCGGRTPGETR